MDFSSKWLVQSTSILEGTNGLLISSEGDDILIISDLSSSTQKKLNRCDLVGDFKYRCDILNILQKTINIHDAENKFIEPSAAKLIDEICEANRLLC